MARPQPLASWRAASQLRRSPLLARAPSCVQRKLRRDPAIWGISSASEARKAGRIRRHSGHSVGVVGSIDVRWMTSAREIRAALEGRRGTATATFRFMSTHRGNQRRSFRVPCCLCVTWVRFGQRIETTALDANLHGLFVRTDDTTLVPGGLMHLEIQMPEGAVLRLFAAARFIGETAAGKGIGAEIFVASPEDRSRWARLYHQLVRDYRRHIENELVVEQTV